LPKASKPLHWDKQLGYRVLRSANLTLISPIFKSLNVVLPKLGKTESSLHPNFDFPPRTEEFQLKARRQKSQSNRRRNTASRSW